jgi:ribosome recycling factor
MSVDTVIKETRPKMESVLEDFKRRITNVRTGRATVGLLDGVMVDYYGVPTPLSQMASVNVPEPQMLIIQPWDATQIGAIEKAINQANLGMNPSNDGKVIRLSIPPPLTKNVAARWQNRFTNTLKNIESPCAACAIALTIR